MQLVYFDHRGQGRSSKCDPDLYNLDENVEDMEALRRHLGLGPIVSIGTSYGGMVAMAHAARYPGSGLPSRADRHRGTWRLHFERARQIVRERGTAEQVSLSARCCGPANFATSDEMRLQRYYAVMGPLYSRRQIRHGRRRSVDAGPARHPTRRSR